MGATGERVLSGLDGIMSDLEDLYRDIHAHPELSMQEWRTAAVGQMWILIPAMALDLLVAFAVLVAITQLLRDDGGPDGGQA